ncbi:MAG: phosphotransferase [Betaproteobacteria bacterium]|nr:MAG: phosphotransferase [Betaproteobacteria bacterium]
MLSRADSKLVGREHSMPGLATVLDAEALAAAWRAKDPAIGIERLSPYYAHYKPGTRCLVGFRISKADCPGELLCYAAAYGPDAASKLPKAREMAQGKSSLAHNSMVILEDIDTVVYTFPADRRLKGLERLASPQPRGNMLRRLLYKQPDYAEATLQTLRYKPERRYVARLDTPEGRRAVVKFYDAPGYRTALHAVQAFASAGASHLAPCTGHLDTHRVLAFDWQPGSTLQTLLSGPDTADNQRTQALELAGAALAGLHAQRPGNLPRRTRDTVRARLRAQAGTIGQLCPELNAVAASLAQDLAVRLDHTPFLPAALHGDFNAEQILIDNDGRATILDLDWAHLGDPAADFGLFLAHLERLALRGAPCSGQIDRYRDALTRGYGRQRNLPGAAAVAFHTAIGLFYRAAEPFRYRETGWPELIGALLARAREILNDAAVQSKGRWASNA